MMSKVILAQKQKLCMEFERLHCSNFYQTNHLLNVSLKRKTENISIILRCGATEKRVRAIFMLQQGFD